ncbi:MAG: helix-turn-helix domain-containing protein [Marinilabiliaceae bacterium]
MADEYLDSRGRLLYVISLSGLTGKEFAARVNVSPSTISQITSTSEKSRKTDLTEMVVNKILSAFPQFNLSYEWLLNGIGPRTIQTKQPSLFEHQSHESDADVLLTKSQLQEPAVEIISALGKVNEVRNGSTQVNIPRTEVAVPSSQSKTDGRSGNERSSDPISSREKDGTDVDSHSTAPQEGHSLPIPPKGVTIERIVILYSDGTFADYSPRVRK